jgi:hypothetical protein
VTLSFMGIGIGDDFLKTGRPGFWEVSEWNRRRRYGMAYDYGSEEDPQNRSLTQSIVIGRKLGSAKEFLCRNIATRPWICGNDRR